MSGVTTATVIGASIASAAIGAGASMYSAHKTSKAQKSAADQQAEASRKALNQQKSEFARQNQNQADVGSLLEGNTGNETWMRCWRLRKTTVGRSGAGRSSP